MGRRKTFLPNWLTRHRAISDQLWSKALAYAPYVRTLARAEQQRLRENANIFLRVKTFEGAADLIPTDLMKVTIAVKACVPILYLGLDYYRDWYEIVLYPGDFRTVEEYTDENGIVHRNTGDLCGQSMVQGPMILSWQTIAEEESQRGHDLVIHECAHKIDALNGGADGYPPLHGDMNPASWAATFFSAYEQLEKAAAVGRDTRIDSYAATDPAEFFAVISETIFSAPTVVYQEFPEVYRQLKSFYHQDPYANIERGAP